MKYASAASLQRAFLQMWGTADHMMKIWFVLKHMGLAKGAEPIAVTTANPTESLKRLFSYGAPDESFFVPFAHTTRFATMKHDAARSIIQTTVKRWQESGSVVTIDPSQYLDFLTGPNDEVLVRTGRNYPIGLGFGKDGFSREVDSRVTIPLHAFAVWYGRTTGIPDAANPEDHLLQLLIEGLHLSPEEIEAVFIPTPLLIDTVATKLTDEAIYRIVTRFLESDPEPQVELVPESFTRYAGRIRSMVTINDGPAWLRGDPEERFASLARAGAHAILLYGPPRTGKTRAVDRYVPRDHESRVTIQIHEGWGYDELMTSLRPLPDGRWEWQDGLLITAINSGKKLIVLEEANRTQLTQALGEVFSLLEDTYRGEKNALILRSGKSFCIPRDVTIIATLNTLDKSTEDIDDAVFGRMASVEFPPRVESLTVMLQQNGFGEPAAGKIRQLFAGVQRHYPLGHGYFAGLRPSDKFVDYYLSWIRPVLQSHLENYRDDDLREIDNTVDQLLGT